MKIDILTLFPEMFAPLSESIIGRAIKKEALDVRCHNIRDYTLNKQKQTDDAPFGGGMGMVMYCQPVYDCFRAVCEQRGTRPHLIYMSPSGRVLTQQRVKELSEIESTELPKDHRLLSEMCKRNKTYSNYREVEKDFYERGMQYLKEGNKIIWGQITHCLQSIINHLFV